MAGRRARGEAHRSAARAADDEGVPRHGALRPGTGVDQPRGLLREADALVLGRLLRPARPRGRGVPGRAAGPEGREALRNAAGRVPPHAGGLDREDDGETRHRLHPRLRGTGRFRRHVDHGAARAGRRGALVSRSRGTTDVRPLPRARVRAARLHPVRIAHRRGARPRRTRRRRARAARLPVRRPAASRVEAVGGGGPPQPARAGLPRRHAAHLGRIRLHPLGARLLRVRGRRPAGCGRGRLGEVGPSGCARDIARNAVRIARLFDRAAGRGIAGAHRRNAHAAGRRHRRGFTPRRQRDRGPGAAGRPAAASGEGPAAPNSGTSARRISQ